MNWKAWLPLGVAVVLGLIAAKVSMDMVSAEPQVIDAVPLQTIVVAARDIDAGTSLTEADLAVTRVEAASASAGSFTSPHEAANKVTKIALSKGQAIMPTVLAEDGAGVGVAATLPPGMRAFTVQVDETSGVAGMIQPTCRVDVVATMQSDGRPKAKTLLENVKVLSVGARLNPNQPIDPGNQAKTVTLLVTPNEAEKLELASSTTRVRLLLRNGRDVSMVGSEGLTVAALRGEPEPTTQPTAKAIIEIPVGMRAYTMEVNDVSGVAGFVQPESRVDVINTVGEGPAAKVKTLLSAVKVLAVGTFTKPNPNGVEVVRTITLLVKPKDVEKMDKATVAGKLRLSLRNGEDTAEAVAEAEEPEAVDAVDGTDPFANPVTRVNDTQSAPKRTWTVEVIKAGARSSEIMQLPTEAQKVPTQVTDVNVNAR